MKNVVAWYNPNENKFDNTTMYAVGIHFLDYLGIETQSYDDKKQLTKEDAKAIEPGIKEILNVPEESELLLQELTGTWFWYEWKPTLDEDLIPDEELKEMKWKDVLAKGRHDDLKRWREITKI